MIPVSDIIVLDFCEWLNKEFKKSKGQNPLTLDTIMGDGNNYSLLTDYAQKYLEKQNEKTECFFKKTLKMFLQSDELNQAIKRCHYCKCTEKYCYDLEHCFHCPEIHSAFHRYCDSNRTKYTTEVTAEYLANNTRELILHGDKNDLKQHSSITKLMTNLSAELSEELSFFSWLETHGDYATDIWKMPSSKFETLVDSYIKEFKKTEADKKSLLKSYQDTGWKELLKKLQILLRIKKRKSKSISETLERYYSHDERYKCIILPLSDDDSQRTYTALISESWEDLNACSGNYLDIYYSEKDTGKSGFDIANRINSLPDKLKLKAPCLIVWEQSMESAEDISISELDNIQIVKLIKSIVESIKSIRCENKFNYIIKEARNKVKKLREEKKSIANYYAPVITGDGNVVGDITVGTGNISGNSNTVTGNAIIYDISVKHIVEDFEAAISEIHKSSELDEDIKSQLVEIFETAKSGVSEQSEEKQKEAKKAFKNIQLFLKKFTPLLVENLANIATIATFFGLVL